MVVNGLQTETRAIRRSSYVMRPGLASLSNNCSDSEAVQVDGNSTRK